MCAATRTNGTSARRATAASDWSFSFRNYNVDFYSDSESDTDAVVRNDTRLLNDFDLASREETVLYKPNPFSIAKINAASRANTASTVASRSEPTKEKTASKLKSTTQPNGNIIDGFKKQAERVQNQPLSANALKPGPVSLQGRAAIIEGGVAAKPLTNFKAINRFLAVKPSVPAKLSSRTIHQRTSAAIRPSDAPSPNVAIAQVLSVNNTASLPPPPGPTARSLDYGTPHHGSSFANAAPRMPVLTSLSISRSPKPMHERTHILAQNQNPTTPVLQLAFPVNGYQSQPGSQAAFGLLSTPVHTLCSSASSPAPYMPGPPPSQSTGDGPRAQFTAMLVPGLNKPKSRPQYGGAFSSPILPPASRFLPSLPPQDSLISSAFASPRPLMPIRIPFSSPLRPSDSCANTFAARTLCAGASDTRAFTSRALDLSHSSRVGFTRNEPGLQLPVQPTLGPPFEYDSQDMLQPPVQMGNDRLYTSTDGFRGNTKREDQFSAQFHAPDNGDNDSAYIRVDSPNWKTPHKYNASSSLARTLDAPPPMQSSQVGQKQGRAIHVYGFDDPEYGSDVICPQTSDQHLNLPPFQCATNAPAPTRPASRPQPQNNVKANPGKRRRDHTASLSASPSPSSSPSPSPVHLPTRLRRSPHNPNSNLHPKSKSKVDGKIRNIDAYAFKGSNHHEAQDEEWSTLPARKKVKTKTGVPALPGVKTSNKFKLPHALLARRGLGKGGKDEECISTTSARRVVLFSPPPPRGATSYAENGTGSSKEGENTALVPDEDVHGWRETKAGSPGTMPNPPAHHTTSISRLSPIRSVFSPSSSPSRYQRPELSASGLTLTLSPNPLRPSISPPRRMEVDPDYPLTPPTSDPAVFVRRTSAEQKDTGRECEGEKSNDPMYVHDHPSNGDVAMHIDIASIGLQYPIVKAYLRG